MKSRRQFLSETFSSFSGFGVAAAFSALGGRLAHGETARTELELVPTKDESTGIPLIRLPEGFRYITYGWTGDQMSDGTKTPSAHDGMGVVSETNGVVSIVRNHEVSSDGEALEIAGGKPFDARAQGGCTSLKFNTNTGEWLDCRVAISGTSRNCAGGVTPWGSWLTAEETVLGVDAIDRYQKNKKRSFQEEHGWVFEVDPSGVANPIPLKAMGRFVHEAVAVDQATSIVYQTEDRGTSGFYRFIPKEKRKLAAGGTLQIAEVIGQQDLRGHVEKGKTFKVRWHTIPEPTRAHSPASSDELGVYHQGKKLGGTTFARLEGCWSGNGLIYFDATSGGRAKAGQIWQFDPKQQELTMLFESPGKQTLNMPDNLCVNPNGGLLLCEDGDYGDSEYPQRMHILTQTGSWFRLL